MANLANMRSVPSQSVDLSDINFLFPVYTECLLLFNVMTSDTVAFLGPMPAIRVVMQ